MYVHIGGEYQIPSRIIISIIDIETSQELAINSSNYEFLRRAEQDNLVELINVDIPRSLIVTLEKVYISPISVATLRKRLENRQIIYECGEK